MSFDTDEASVQDSRPRELYTFELATATYNLTSHSEDISYGGTLYSAAVASRGSVPILSMNQDRELVVTLPIDHPFVQDFLLTGIPPRTARLIIVRLQPSGARRIWKAEIGSCTTDDVYARFQMPSVVARKFSVGLPVVSASRVCNHALYDAGCTLERVDYTVFFSEVVSVDGQLVTVSNMDGHADNWARFGEIVRNADGEARDVLEQTGTVLRVDVPFRALNPGDRVVIRKGCDHTPEMCRDDFGNIENYGGHPDLPSTNPQAPTGLGVIVQS